MGDTAYIDAGAGNTAQTRKVIEQTAEILGERMQVSDEALNKRIDERVNSALNKFRLSMFAVAFAQMVPAFGAAYYIGGISQQMNDALDTIKDQQLILAGRGEWMNRRESWEQEVERWAEPKGFLPPRERKETR